jgi:hypothetical protein
VTKWKNPDLSDGQHMTILGFGAASPGYWAQVVALQQARVRQWQEELAGYVDAATASRIPIPEVYGSDARISLAWLVGIDAHYLVYAADHALTICRRYQGLSGNDPRICRAISKFEKSVGEIASMRDLLAHFEDYAVGSGRLGRGRQHDGPQIDFVMTIYGVRSRSPREPPPSRNSRQRSGNWPRPLMRSGTTT